MTPFIADADFTLYVGDVREVLAGLPDESVHCVVTSPPYWGLRSYGHWNLTSMLSGPNGDEGWQAFTPPRKRRHRWYIRLRWRAAERGGVMAPNGKAWLGQLGLEPTPELFVKHMTEVFREVRRVLRRDGTCWLNIGDSYASDPKKGGSGTFNGRNGRGEEYARGKRIERGSGRWGGGNVHAPALKAKDLCGIPWRLAFALQADGWYLRSEIIWAKPNPMPESVTDRPTKSHEQVFLLTRSPRYFYDADAVREPQTPDGRLATRVVGRDGSEQHRDGERWPNPSGRNLRSVWTIATEPYPDAHFATFPQALVEPCVKAGTSERGCCPECGAPWEREIEKHFHSGPTYKQTGEDQLLAGRNRNVTRMGDGVTVETTGWRPTCDHAHEPVPCCVMDLFMGSGTTAVIARRLGRKAIGIELSPKYARLCARRTQQQSLLPTEAA